MVAAEPLPGRQLQQGQGPAKSGDAVWGILKEANTSQDSYARKNERFEKVDQVMDYLTL